MENSEFPREISLCLSGGAARGAYQLGVIDILEKKGVAIKAISGSSIGSMVGAAIASGRKAEDVLATLKSKKFKKIFKLNIGKGSLFRIDRDSEVINDFIDSHDFESLKIPLIVSASDVIASKNILFQKGSLLDAVLASSSLPPLLASVQVNDSIYADGCYTDNFPVEPLKKYGYPILGINLFPNPKALPKSTFAWIKRLLYVAFQHNNLTKEKECDFFLTNEALVKMSTYGFRDLDKMYKLGQDDMKKLLKQYA